MNIHKHIRLFLSLAAGVLLAVGLTVALATAQGPSQDGAPPEPPELHAEMLEYRLERPAPSAGSRSGELSTQSVGAAADVRPPGSFDVVLLSEDFEWGGVWGGRWTYDGLWHPVLGYLDIGHPYSRSHSLVYSMWYGQDGTGNYDTGARTVGSLTTAITHAVNIPTSAVSVTVSFWSWEETETEGTPSKYDIRALAISGTVTTTWELLWSTYYTPTIEGQWHQVVADISGYRGQKVRLSFIFDSWDEEYNNYEGWYLDDVAIVAHGVAVPGYDLSDAWVQSFYEDYPNPTPDREIHLDRVQAAGVTPWQVTDDGDEQSSAAVAAHPVRDVPVVWTHSYTNTHGMPVGDVEYTALNRDGATSIPLTKVSDNSGATFPSVEDFGPTVAANPADGSTVIAWTHCLSCPVSYLTRVYNVHYAIRDSSGGVVKGPTALSSNSGNQVQDYNPAVETFPNGNVLIAWRHRDYDTPLHDVFFTVLDRQGNTVKTVDNLSGSSSEIPYAIRLARLADGNILVVWMEDYLDVFYAVVDSSGHVVKAPTNLTNYDPSYETEGWYPEAVGLANGNAIIAWSEFTDYETAAQIRYAVLGGTYNMVKPPTMLPNPYNAAVNGAVSMVADEADAAILTWPDISYPYLHLYYARLDNQGNVLTGPTIYRQTRGSIIYPSSRGYGIGGLPCNGLDDISITGPLTGTVGTGYTFTATVSPADALQPITYTWEATGQTPETHTVNAISDTVSFTWPVIGTQTVTVTAVNECGVAVSTSRDIAIELGKRYIYLPLILKNW